MAIRVAQLAATAVADLEAVTSGARRSIKDHVEVMPMWLIASLETQQRQAPVSQFESALTAAVT
jgi:hypothetical protein